MAHDFRDPMLFEAYLLSGAMRETCSSVDACRQKVEPEDPNDKK